MNAAAPPALPTGAAFPLPVASALTSDAAMTDARTAAETFFGALLVVDANVAPQPGLATLQTSGAPVGGSLAPGVVPTAKHTGAAAGKVELPLASPEIVETASSANVMLAPSLPAEGAMPSASASNDNVAPAAAAEPVEDGSALPDPEVAGLLLAPAAAEDAPLLLQPGTSLTAQAEAPLPAVVREGSFSFGKSAPDDVRDVASQLAVQDAATTARQLEPVGQGLQPERHRPVPVDSVSRDLPAFPEASGPVTNTPAGPAAPPGAAAPASISEAAAGFAAQAPAIQHAGHPTPPPPVTAPVPMNSQFAERLGLAIARRAAEGSDEVVLRMEPAELGRIHVRLSFDEAGSLRAIVAAESPMVIEALRRDSADLARALAEAGVRTDERSFTFDRGNDGNLPDQQPRSPQRWQQLVGDGRALADQASATHDDAAPRHGRLNLFA